MNPSQLFKEFHTPPHIQRHCKVVADLAVKLGRKFAEKGEKVDLDLLQRAALIHDFVRVIDFRKFDAGKFSRVLRELREKYAGLHHAEAGARILEERGFADEARLVRSHRFLQIERGFDSLEEKLLYYADKRVKHDKIVPLKERLEDGCKRNVPEILGDEAAQKNAARLNKKVFELEREIFKTAGEM